MLKSYPKKIEISTCEDEPIRFIHRTQSHGVLLVIDNDFNILQYSKNATDFLNVQIDLLNSNLSTLLHDEVIYKLKIQLINNDFKTVVDGEFSYKLSLSNEGLLLDIEKYDSTLNLLEEQQLIISALNKMSSCNSVQEVLNTAVNEIKHFLNYDRVMVYKFDADWNGEVIAEAANNDLHSWLGLHYPAGDIPKNARDLFKEQGVRIISNLKEPDYPLFPMVNPQSGFLTNLSNSILRGSSDIHKEYLGNMGVCATLSCAIVIEDKLWGLIACHHYSPKFIDFQKRQTCFLLSDIISNQITIKTSNDFISRLNQNSHVRSKLVHYMSEKWDLVHGLTNNEVTALDLVKSDAFIIKYDTQLSSIGLSLEDTDIKNIIKKFEVLCDENGFYSSNSFSKETSIPSLEKLQFAGVVLYKISKKKGDCIIWLRKEQIAEINWGGNPDKKQIQGNLTPRKSFEKFTEQVREHSIPWQTHEIAAIKAFVEDVKNIIVTKFSEVSKLNRQLLSLNQELESFSYSVSHDLRGPLRGIDGFAQILMEDYMDQLDEDGKQSLQIIINSAARMNDLMDSILSYSGLSKLRKIDDDIDVEKLCNDIVKDSNMKRRYPKTQFNIQKGLPSIYGDRAMLYQLFFNLLSNAFKYSSKKEAPQVTVSQYNDGEKDVYVVTDNGVGFDPKYGKKIFGVFTRLVKEEYEGTGVGLAIAQRVVFRHGGDIWAESELNKGTTIKFYFKSIR
ncbi:ATP-binding protein [Nonlabens tegetincola]|uniref:ATP-binding protein n=1 Tax=Nonlabens tegetincola TaxID=323273 RepID=UPI0030C871DC